MNGSLRYQSFRRTQATATTLRAEEKISENFSVADFGAAGDGVTDDAPAINNAITALIAAGGGVLNLLNGKTYLCGSNLVFPAGANQIILDGHGSTIRRGAALPQRTGLFDLQAAQTVRFLNLVVDGDVTVAIGVLYSQIGGDPLIPLLSTNTSFWLHAGCSDIDFENVTVTHTGGYAILSDTTTGSDNMRIRIRGCTFLNNRPHLFGVTPGNAIYGSWTGGILYAADCSAANKVGVTQNLLVSDCVFQRNAGIGVWGHNAGYYNFHSGVVIADNSFLDQGLDAIEVSCTITGACGGNTGRRIGYVCQDDTQPSAPRYLPGANATFIDHSGYVEAVSMTGNSCTSVCGGFSSLDGFAYGSCTGNDFRQPQPGDAFYVEDQIGLIPAGVVYGFDCANTFGDVGGIVENGGAGICMIGNTLYGCSAGSIIAIAVRESKIADNDIWQPGNSTNPPILLGNQSAQVYQQCFSNSVTGNRIYWSPATPAAAIIESETWSGGSIPWLAGEYNWIEKNHIFDTAGNAFEVSLAPSTVSLTGPQISSAVANPTAAGYTSLRRLTAADGSAGYSSVLGTSGTEYFRLVDGGNYESFADVPAVGFVSTSGTAVTWISGPVFFSAMAGTSIVINGVTYAISAFVDNHHLTLGSSAGAQASAAYAYSFAGTVNTAGTAVMWVSGEVFFPAMVGRSFTIAGATYFVATYVDNHNITLTTSAGTQAGALYAFGNAFQTSTLTAYITGAGNAFFQSVNANSFRALTFVSTADLAVSPSTTPAFETSTGTFVIYGDGHGTFQNLTCTTVFNSKSDLAVSPAATAAFQTSTGTMVVYGDGHAIFQNITCTTVFNSESDLAGSPSTTAAFQTSTGTMVIYGDGHATFQAVAATSGMTIGGQAVATQVFVTAAVAAHVAADHAGTTTYPVAFTLTASLVTGVVTGTIAVSNANPGTC